MSINAQLLGFSMIMNTVGVNTVGVNTVGVNTVGVI